ncbi:Dihydrolipoamide acyltransferase component of branched-chain alpha-keto acid dehydrogenase complex [hydrothermal vent metagenome]|uniref:Dihydrolipoamide acyltransferase component of branched-chain alpha-keto acid dehydrogenase complex n=1 Tax=hydrothermal vent metagenome TaxID=652676 RepID=A0A3B0Y398_9ZZZZ
MSIFKLPDLGEGLPEAEIVEWFIKEGDTVEADKNIVSMETAKAIVDIPSPQAGKITRLFGAPGDIIHTGDPLLEFAGDEAGTEEAEVEKDTGTVVGEIPTGGEIYTEQPQQFSSSGRDVGIKATPAVRALARRMDVDLSMVSPSGPNDTIIATDIERVAGILQQVGKLEPLRGVRRAMANAMSHAHAEVASVTLNDDADIGAWADAYDVTIRLVRAMVKASKAEPSLNAWYDSHSMGRRLIKQVHMGIAVDTDQGLFVPVIENVNDLSDAQLREQINMLKEQLVSRKLPAESLRGNTITLSNFGAIGGRYANPVIVPPTVAILGAGRICKEPVAVGDKVEVHKRMPLSLSFDHRAVTGGEATRFMVAVIDDLEKEK